MNRFLPTRRLVPRWRKSTFSLGQPDMLGLVRARADAPSFSTDDGEVARAMEVWKQTGAVGELADLLAFGVDSANAGVLHEPARAALELEGLPAALRLVAQEILSHGVSVDEVWRLRDGPSEVRVLRALLRAAPNNVIALVDLAQHYLAAGKTRAAHRALATAHQLSPHSVYVLRAFARFWIHLEQPDRAHSVVKASPLLATDPWVMASEIAISQVAEQQSVQLRKAQRALASKRFGEAHVSELAGAIAGAELRSGNFKEARKLFRLALTRPNDNVLAQAITNQQHLGIEVDEQLLRRAPNGAFEGRTLTAMVSGDFESAARFAEKWSEEESFSSRPRTLQSYFYGALGDYERSLQAANLGLISDQGDESLRGNRAYALAGLGRFDEAELELRSLEPALSELQRPFLLATRGMIRVLKGEGAEGLQLYEAAVTEFTKLNQQEHVTDCLAFMARTAAAAEIDEAEAVLRRASERFRQSPSPAASVILKTLHQPVAEIKPPALRKVVQWEWNPKDNVLVEKRALTRKGAPSFLVSRKEK